MVADIDHPIGFQRRDNQTNQLLISQTSTLEYIGNGAFHWALPLAKLNNEAYKGRLDIIFYPGISCEVFPSDHTFSVEGNVQRSSSTRLQDATISSDFCSEALKKIGFSIQPDFSIAPLDPFPDTTGETL